MERPKVIYNERTGKLVMWFHLELKGKGYAAARTGVAVSDKVAGPYKYLRSYRPNEGSWPINCSEEIKKLNHDFERKGGDKFMEFLKRDMKKG